MSSNNTVSLSYCFLSGPIRTDFSWSKYLLKEWRKGKPQKNVLSSYFKHKVSCYVFKRQLIDRLCFAGKLKVWELYDHREVKGQGKSLLLIFVLRLDLGMIHPFVHISDFLFIWKIEEHRELPSHILPSLFWSKVPPFHSLQQGWPFTAVGRLELAACFCTCSPWTKNDYYMFKRSEKKKQEGDYWKFMTHDLSISIWSWTGT